MSTTDVILDRLLGLHPKLIDLNLDRIERLLELLGRPQDRLPPTVHVAGTNGKGSTIAFMRAFLEASGKRVHVYTSPHLVRFNERIRLAGSLVSDAMLNAALTECERVNGGAPITFFEITTAAAFKLFAEVSADYLLLEVGLGGEFDATNVIDRPIASVITPVAVDHVQFLGNTTGQIAKAKAGIMKRGAPAIFGRQTEDGLETLNGVAARLGITPFVAGQDFDGYAQNGRMVYQDDTGLLDLPAPKLVGAHQIDNAALAIATVRHVGLPVSDTDIERGLVSVDWPARLTPLRGKLMAEIQEGQELWLDGGHNAHGSEALARALEAMNRARPAPLVLIVGMLDTRPAEDFFAAFIRLQPSVFTLRIPGQAHAYSAEHLADAARNVGLEAEARPDLGDALHGAAQTSGARIVICGSLYLAGTVLERNGTLPS